MPEMTPGRFVYCISIRRYIGLILVERDDCTQLQWTFSLLDDAIRISENGWRPFHVRIKLQLDPVSNSKRRAAVAKLPCKRAYLNYLPPDGIINDRTSADARSGVTDDMLQ